VVVVRKGFGPETPGIAPLYFFSGCLIIRVYAWRSILRELPNPKSSCFVSDLVTIRNGFEVARLLLRFSAPLVMERDNTPMSASILYRRWIAMDLSGAVFRPPLP
jgi:hypothetical protein